MHRFLLSAAFCLVLLAPRTAATYVVPLTPADDSPRIESHLPLTTSDERALIAAARDMPSAKLAVRECLSRGYIRHPEADRATAPVLGTSAAVFLAFEKPGYVPPPNCVGSPMILVATLRSDGSTRSKVSAGFVILDGNRKSMYVWNPDMDPPGGTSMTDAPFEVVGDRYVLLEENMKVFLQVYAICAAISNSACVVLGFGTGFMATPIVGIGTALVCIANRTHDCLSRAFAYWPGQ